MAEAYNVMAINFNVMTERNNVMAECVNVIERSVLMKLINIFCPAIWTKCFTS